MVSIIEVFILSAFVIYAVYSVIKSVIENRKETKTGEKLRRQEKMAFREKVIAALQEERELQETERNEKGS